MNAVLYKKKQMLDMKWNVQIDVFFDKTLFRYKIEE